MGAVASIVSDADEDFLSRIVHGPESSIDPAVLCASALNSANDSVVRMCDYRVLRYLDELSWLDVTAVLLESSTEDDAVQAAVLMFLRVFCEGCDPKRDFAISARQRIVGAIRGLSAPLCSKYDSLKARAHLQDVEVFQETCKMPLYERIQIAEVLGTDDALEFLKELFADTSIDCDRLSVAHALAMAGDRSGVDYLKQVLAMPGWFSIHMECAIKLARLDELEGMAYLLPILELDAEDSRCRFEAWFRFDREFIDVRKPSWREELITRFRNRLYP